MSAEAPGLTRTGANIMATVLRLRFTMLFLAVMVIANLLAGTLWQPLPHRLLAAWGIGFDPVLSGDLFRLITGTFLSHDPDMFVRQILFAALVIGHTELQRGGVRTAALFFGLDIVGTLILLACVGWAVGIADLTSHYDVGMSIGGFGLIGLALAGWRGRWLIFSAILGAILAKFVTEPDPLADGGHAIALMLGFVLGLALKPPQWPRSQDVGNAG